MAQLTGDTNWGQLCSLFIWSLTDPQRSRRDDTILLTSTEYNNRGEAFKTIDPKAIENRREFDHAGRVTKLIENYVPSPTTPDQNRTTEMTYTGDNLIKTLTAKNSVTLDQVTTWVYGTTLSDSGVARNDLVRAMEFPEKSSSSDRVEYKYSRLSELKAITDQIGSVREFVNNGH